MFGYKCKNCHQTITQIHQNGILNTCTGSNEGHSYITEQSKEIENTSNDIQQSHSKKQKLNTDIIEEKKDDNDNNNKLLKNVNSPNMI